MDGTNLQHGQRKLCAVQGNLFWILLIYCTYFFVWNFLWEKKPSKLSSVILQMSTEGCDLWMFNGYVLAFTPQLCLSPYLIVDCIEVPHYSNLCGHVQRVLWGLCDLQLHDLPVELSGPPVSQPGPDAGGPGTAETPASSLLVSTLADGRVSL